MSVSGILSSNLSQYALGAANNLYQQDFKQLGQDLKSGNLSAAQSDFSTLQQDLQKVNGSSTNRMHHQHRLHTGGGDLTGQNSPLQDLNELGQDLASGNLSAAQQAYTTLQAQPLVSTGGRQPTGPPVYAPPVSTGGGRQFPVSLLA